ncbi:MAG: molecular chaperone DnaJ [Candidatus Marinimicrobia bacterium]|nr:molecular chaperone DnaJ [Candidatus Neomarinimicrobiota bacterium]MBL7022654.1 molecular chaperone DnaJ [Candidatus Neomarinimicrobiota bacterium]MBL7109922.1 molecular chaperone DnaJ [Candidatus Neomarinimicrobiota bacterium]
MRDYYEILGVDKNASSNEIKKAYRKVAMKYHPDKNPEDEQAEKNFKEAAEAYSILKDDNKRARYNQFGHSGFENASGFGGGGFTDINDIFSTFGDIFSGGGFGDIFGRRTQGRQYHQKGSDLKISIGLTLEEIQKGTTKTVKIKRLEACGDCNGSGARPGTKPTTCPTCHGNGEVRQVQQSFLGQVINVQPCYQCKGSGEIISNPCRSCRGDGRVKKTSTIEIEIPQGVSTGNYMTKQNEGNHGPKGSIPGNLIVYFDEKTHQLFTRDGNNILLETWIQYPQAVFGETIEIPTLAGKVKLKIPAGIKSGQVLRLKGKGIPELNSHRQGDLLVKVQILTPSKLSGKVKDLLKSLKQELPVEPKFEKFS